MEMTAIGKMTGRCSLVVQQFSNNSSSGDFNEENDDTLRREDNTRVVSGAYHLSPCGSLTLRGLEDWTQFITSSDVYGACDSLRTWMSLDELSWFVLTHTPSGVNEQHAWGYQRTENITGWQVRN